MNTFNSKAARIAASVVRVLLGCFFIVSALAKLIGIDNFEIYVFSYNILSLNVSFIVARLVIVIELLLGIGLVSHVWKRFIDTMTLLALVCFTLFLGYAAILGRTDSCQCMGSLVDLNPIQSILKNAGLIILLLIAMGAKEWQWQRRWLIWLFVILGILGITAGVFVRSAPDNWLYPASEEMYNRDQLQKAIAPDGDLASFNLNEGRHVIAFLSPTCKLCKMADEKMAHIYRRNDLDSNRFIYLTYAADSTLAPLSVNDTSFIRPSYVIPTMTFALITYGQRPMVFLLNNGEVNATFHYRNIDEKTIVDFMKKED